MISPHSPAPPPPLQAFNAVPSLFLLSHQLQTAYFTKVVFWEFWKQNLSYEVLRTYGFRSMQGPIGGLIGGRPSSSSSSSSKRRQSSSASPYHLPLRSRRPPKCSCAYIGAPLVFALAATAVVGLIAFASFEQVKADEKHAYAVPLLLLSVVPSFLILYAVYWRTHYTDVPPAFVGCMFLCGIFVAMPIAYLEALLSRSIFPTTASSPGHVPRSVALNLGLSVVLAFLFVPLAEELPRILATWWRIHASRPYMTAYGMVVVAVSFALGFAMLENANYILAPTSRLSHALITAVVRGFLSVPLHFCCGVYVGEGFVALYRPSAPPRLAAATPPRCAALSFPWWARAGLRPMLLHGLYDFLVRSAEWVRCRCGVGVWVGRWVGAANACMVSGGWARGRMISW